MTRMNSTIMKAGIAAAAGLVIVGGMALKLAAKDDQGAADAATFTVKRGPLTISISESGTIKARDQEIIKNEVEGKTTVLWVIKEGTHVKKGDLLVELDASTMMDSRIDQQTVLQNAETAWIAARESLEVGRNQAQADVDLAQLKLDFTKLDLEKYTGQKGEYESQRTEAEASIRLAEEELTRARDKLEWSEKLALDNYISSMELQTDKLAYNKAALNVELAKNRLNLLEQFTYRRQLSQLNSDVSQAEMALERTKRSSAAKVIQLEAELRAAEARLQREKLKLSKLEDQIAKATIRAPADGLVVYASSARADWRGNQQPLEDGQTLAERAELIYLPTTDSVKAEIKVHESSMEKVKVGLPVIVTVDALKGKSFTGRVAKIALLPDATSMWLNPDLKVYTTEIFLEGDNTGLRTGMSCRAEIIVDRYEDVVHIPVQAVVKIARQPTVYVRQGNRFVERQVEIGMDNNRMVHIKSGLEPDEVVLLTPPLAPAEVRQAEETDRLNGLEMPPMSDGLRGADEGRVPSGTGGVGDGERPARPQEGRGRSGRVPAADGGDGLTGGGGMEGEGGRGQRPGGTAGGPMGGSGRMNGSN